MKTNIRFLTYIAQFSLKLKMFQTKALEKFETHFTFNDFFFLEKIVPLMR
jgi:hypothetical protein